MRSKHGRSPVVMIWTVLSMMPRGKTSCAEVTRFRSVAFVQHSRCDVGFSITLRQDIWWASPVKTQKSIHRFLSAEGGTTAVEYAVLLTMILVAILIGVTSAGGGVSGWWGNISRDMEPIDPEPPLVLPAGANPTKGTSRDTIRFAGRRYQGWSRPGYR